MELNWLAIGLTLALLFVFGIVYAAMVRWMARKHIIEGQTATVVVGGVLVTVLASSVLNGWLATALTLACFSASGLPMMIEYIARVADNQVRDRESAERVAKDLL